MKEMILQTVADKGPQNVQDIADMLESVPVAIGEGRQTYYFYFCRLSYRIGLLGLHVFVKILLNHFYSIFRLVWRFRQRYEDSAPSIFLEGE